MEKLEKAERAKEEVMQVLKATNCNMEEACMVMSTLLFSALTYIERKKIESVTITNSEGAYIVEVKTA